MVDIVFNPPDKVYVSSTARIGIVKIKYDPDFKVILVVLKLYFSPGFSNKEVL